MNISSYKTKRHNIWLFLKSEKEKPFKEQDDKLIKRLEYSHKDCCKRIRDYKLAKLRYNNAKR